MVSRDLRHDGRRLGEPARHGPAAPGAPGRLKAELDKSDLGALLTFDFHNIRYMTATHIGTWAMDKMIRFALLPRGGDPVLWDFGSAARHHQLHTPWLDEPHDAAGRGPHYGARAGISTLRGAISPGPDGPRTSPPRSPR